MNGESSIHNVPVQILMMMRRGAEPQGEGRGMYIPGM